MRVVQSDLFGDLISNETISPVQRNESSEGRASGEEKQSYVSDLLNWDSDSLTSNYELSANNCNNSLPGNTFPSTSNFEEIER